MSAVERPSIDRFRAIAHHRVGGILEIPAGLGDTRDETLRTVIALLQAGQAIRAVGVSVAHLAGSEGIATLAGAISVDANQAYN